MSRKPKRVPGISRTAVCGPLWADRPCLAGDAIGKRGFDDSDVYRILRKGFVNRGKLVVNTVEWEDGQ